MIPSHTISQEKTVKIIEKTVCYDGFFKLIRYQLQHSLFAGGWSQKLIREVLERGQAVAVLLYDPVQEQVVLIEQFRPGALEDSQGAWLLEIVAGIIEPGETPSEVAKREVQEEAGCVVSDLIRICDFFVSPGSTSETTTLFCGRVNSSQISGIHGVKDENEDIQVHIVPFKKALEWFEQGKIRYAPAIIALQWLALYHETVKQEWGCR